MTLREFDAAVSNSVSAQRAWAATPVSLRQRYLMDYVRLLRDSQADIAQVITLEHGKTLSDSMGDMFRGLEVVEQACNAAVPMMGETSRDVARGIDTYSYKEPLGVTAGICSFRPASAGRDGRCGCFRWRWRRATR